MHKCEEEIIELKKIGHDHQQEIDNLLKFNQRLLSIIQNQMPNKVLSRTSSGSNLHPIDEINEKQHDNLVIPHRFTTQSHPIKDKVQHVDVDEIDRMSDQAEEEDFKKHVNLPPSSNGNMGNLNLDPKNNSDGFRRFRNAQSYDGKLQRPQLSSGRNSTEHNQENIIYREEKQSLIEIPKFFKLEKGLNDHYQKQLFQSVEDPRKLNTNSFGHGNFSNNNNNSNNLNNNNVNTGILAPPALHRLSNRKQSLPSVSSQMNKISEAVTERLVLSEEELSNELATIRQLIDEYKEDFDTQEYTHLCSIIKSDLQNDLKQLVAVNSESIKFYTAKEKQLHKLKVSIDQFNPVQKLFEIIRKLNVSEQTQKLILDKIAPNTHVNGKAGK